MKTMAVSFKAYHYFSLGAQANRAKISEPTQSVLPSSYTASKSELAFENELHTACPIPHNQFVSSSNFGVYAYPFSMPGKGYMVEMPDPASKALSGRYTDYDVAYAESIRVLNAKNPDFDIRHQVSQTMGAPLIPAEDLIRDVQNGRRRLT